MGHKVESFRTMRSRVPVNWFYCVSVTDSPSRIFTFSSRCSSITHLACKRFNCTQICRQTAQLAMCWWPPAKSSASCLETDVPPSSSERGAGRHLPAPIQVVASLCDITEGWLTRCWARWQSGEAAFSRLWPGHVQISRSRFWSQCVRNVKHLLSPVCSFGPWYAQCAPLSCKEFLAPCTITPQWKRR